MRNAFIRLMEVNATQAILKRQRKLVNFAI